MLDDGRRRPPGPHRDRRRRRPGPVHRPAGRAGHRAHARRSRSASPCTASARSTCSRPRRSAPARSAPTFLVATDARRKEVYWATYDAQRRPADRPRGRPARRRRDRAPGGGRGRGALPEAFPHAVGPTRALRRLAGPRGRRRSAPSCVDPEPLYLRRPDAVAPGPPKAVS